MNSNFNSPSILKVAILAVVSVLSFNKANAQANTIVKSSNGYNVLITLDVVRIISPNSCKWGYNYNTRISYDIQFAGNNIPKNLYTLQTTLECGSDDNFTSLPLKGGKGEKNTHSNPWNPNSDCSTVTPASLNCNTFELEIEGPGIARQTLRLSIQNALPVSMISYTAETVASNVVLNWKTSSELNNSHFVIERSSDANNWTEIGKVDAVKEQNSVNEYMFTDRTALEGTSYYRLTQVDVDGKTTVYNNILMVNHAPEIKFEVYPNPASTQFTVTGDNIEMSEITILDAMGAVMNIQGEVNGSSVAFSTENLNVGIYFVNVTSGNQQKSYKITVAK